MGGLLSACWRGIRHELPGSRDEKTPLLLDHAEDDAEMGLPPQEIVHAQQPASSSRNVVNGVLLPTSGARPKAAPAPYVPGRPVQEAPAQHASLAQEPPRHQAVGSRAEPRSGLAEREAAPQAASATAEFVQRAVQLPGRRRSLLVGINYFGSSAELSGCINDIKRVQSAICERFGFSQDAASQRVLLDEPGWPGHLRPTRANMLEAMAWLAEGAQTGDALYFHYSGHGGRRPDGDGGYNETLCPVDMDYAGELLDRELFELLVKPLPTGCRLTCFMDCCHSQGVLDLPYVFVGTKENIDKALAGEVQEMVVSKNWMSDMAAWQHGRSEELLGDIAGMGLGLWDLYRKRQEAKQGGAGGFMGSEAAENAGLAVGEVIAFTGCRSDQTSADVGNVHSQFNLGRTVSTADHAGGALTAVFLESLAEQDSEEFTYLRLLEQMRARLESEGFSQVPQLASSLLVELKQHFSLTTAFIPPDPSKQAGKDGFDGTDAALLGGSAVCAAGFLAALAKAPEGEGLMAQSRSLPFGLGASASGGEREAGSRDMGAGEGGGSVGGWGGQQLAGLAAAAPLTCWGTEAAEKGSDSPVREASAASAGAADQHSSWWSGADALQPPGHKAYHDFVEEEAPASEGSDADEAAAYEQYQAEQEEDNYSEEDEPEDDDDEPEDDDDEPDDGEDDFYDDDDEL
eukprot:TRINITY_DN21974_c0_g1_i1.p1 TRINITY_DN21974_c0_g1~~TRINITY_DN21974_c0_g1_i1.p1  ORF type:complete len:686 (+),score=212.25 TRINITY_DN21974_c0_g1_i1:222-2279(+)